MPTISSSANIDQVTFTSSFGNEDVTINRGVTVTVNSDNYHAQCSRVWGTTVSINGNLTVDGREVWWIPFDASSGTIPALPTFGTNTVTVGGTPVGEFLGIWSDIGVTVPMVAGFTMPTTGYVKLRRKVANIADNDVLTFANGATATVNSATGGQRGWITFSGPKIQNFAITHRSSVTQFLGDWFEIGTCNGSAGQTMQYYVNDAIPAIQVETGAGTGVYEWWCAVGNRSHFTTTWFDTSTRSKVFDVTANGLITFNGVGGTVGQLPPNGARVRVPNIHIFNYTDFGSGSALFYGRQMAGTITCTTSSTTVTGVGTDFDNKLVGTQIRNTSGVLIGTVLSVASTTSLTLTANAAVAVTGGGYSTKNAVLSRSNTFTGTDCFKFSVAAETSIVLENITGQFQFLQGNVTGTFRNCAFGAIRRNNAMGFSQLVVEDCALCGPFSEQSGQCIFAMSGSSSSFVSSINKFTIGGFTDTLFGGNGASLFVTNGTIENVISFHSSPGETSNLSLGGTNATIKNCYLSRSSDGSGGNTPIVRFGGSNILVQNIDFSTSNRAGLTVGQIATINASGVYDNFRMVNGKGSTGTASFNIGNGISIVCRNWGSPGSRQDFGGNHNFSGGTATEFFLSKIYIVAGTAGFDINLSANFRYYSEVDTSSTSTTPLVAFGVADREQRRVYNIAGSVTNGVSVGTHGYEYVNSVTTPTEIQLAFYFNRYSSFQRSRLRITPGPGLVFPDLSVARSFLEVSGRFVTNETLHYIKGITGFVNAAPTFPFSPVGSITYEYDLDRGTGFTGTYKSLTGANLSAETNISPTGLRIKIKATASSTANDTATGSVAFRATTNSTAFYNNQYGDKIVEHTISGIQPGSVAYMFRTDTGALLSKTREVVTGTLSLNPEWISNIPVAFRLRDQGYDTIENSFTMTAFGFNTPVTQIPNIISTAVPGAWGITVTNHGASPVTWNSKQWSITITSTGGQTAAEITQFIHYWLNQDAGTFDSSLPNAAFHDLIIPSGTDFETARGTVYGSAGAALKGVRVVDGSGNEIPGFARMQADDGTYYVSPTVATIAVSNLVSGDRVLVARDNGSGAILKDEYTPVAASTGATSIQVVESIKTDTPTSGVIRIKNERYTYSGYNTGTKTFSGLSPALTQNIVAGDDVFVPFIDKATTTTSESVTFLYSSTFGVTVDVRNGSATPIIPFRTTASVTSTGASINTIRTADI